MASSLEGTAVRWSWSGSTIAAGTATTSVMAACAAIAAVAHSGNRPARVHMAVTFLEHALVLVVAKPHEYRLHACEAEHRVVDSREE